MIGSLVVDAAGWSKVVCFHPFSLFGFFILAEVNPQTFKFNHIHTELEHYISEKRNHSQAFLSPRIWEVRLSSVLFSDCEKYGFCLAELATIQKKII